MQTETDDLSEQNPNGVPNAKNHPVKAAEKMLRRTRGEMSGDLYDDHEEVREWAANIEWAITALAEHEDSAYDSIEEASDYE